MSFVKTFKSEDVPKIGTIDTSKEMLHNFENLLEEVLKNMHSLSPICTGDCLFLVDISREIIIPIWSDCIEHEGS